MKNTFQTLTAVALFLGATLNSIAQTWNTGGNEIIGSEWFGADPNSDIPVRFEHRADEDESRFEWYTHDGVDVDERKGIPFRMTCSLAQNLICSLSQRGRVPCGNAILD